MKIRVRQCPSGLDPPRGTGLRAVLALLAAASIPVVLLGPAGTTAVASGEGHAQAAAHAAAHAAVRSEGEGWEHEHRGCGHVPPGRQGNPHVHRSDCSSAASHRLLTATSTAAPTPPAAPKSATTRTASVRVSYTSRPLLVTPRAPRAPLGQRPPVLAPPGLAAPSHAAAGAITATPVSIYLITVSGLLLATAVGIAALVLVRRSD